MSESEKKMKMIVLGETITDIVYCHSQHRTYYSPNTNIRNAMFAFVFIAYRLTNIIDINAY